MMGVCGVDVVFLNLSASYMGVPTLWKFTRLHTHREVYCSDIKCTSMKKIFFLFIFNYGKIHIIKFTTLST